MRNRVVRMAGTAVLLGLSALLGTAASGGDSNDKLTGLPLHPGLSFSQEVDSPVCGKKAQINLYDTQADAKLAEYVAWYKAQLKGFTYGHQMWADRAQEMFYSPDGTSGVTLTGMPNGEGVFAVSYEKMAPGLKPEQLVKFSPNNPTCK